jgi:hypothetical protein
MDGRAERAALGVVGARGVFAVALRMVGISQVEARSINRLYGYCTHTYHGLDRHTGGTRRAMTGRPDAALLKRWLGSAR